ncbi:hypothetical protein [Pseudomonas sp. BBP2017]|uniref:hypothetical protein n=1 Tax=Pseudomonas sp. BBP2017 TaxID=2109731 RepID=UPI0015AD62E2|nr:hypothetical protein [Pseudomonas sp. BBP2017]
MAHGVGYFIEIEGEPSLYLCGDTLLTDQIRQFVALHQPEVSVVPAGGACLDIGSEIIMGVEEVIEFTQSVRGRLIARLLIPADGEAVDVRLATNSEQARG